MISIPARRLTLGYSWNLNQEGVSQWFADKEGAPATPRMAKG